MKPFTPAFPVRWISRSGLTRWQPSTTCHTAAYTLATAAAAEAAPSRNMITIWYLHTK
jgi:hypothetical protein